jgi:amino acid transporter
MTAYAALCNLFIGYLGFFWPDISTGWTRAVAITAVTLAFAAVNLLGVRESSLVGNVFTVGKLVPLILFVAIGAFFLNPGQFQHRVEVPRFGDFSTAVLLLLFAFSGFETAVIPSGEVREPQRHLPFGLLVGMCVVVLLYVSIQIVCIGTLPELEHSERPIVEASNRFLGTAGATCIMLGAFVSVAGTMNAIVLAAPRLLFAMAEHGQLPRGLAAVHPRFRTPHVAIVLTTLVMLVLTLQGTFVSSLTISTVSRLIAYTATCLALPVLRRRADRAPFHLPGGNMVAAAATVLSLWLLLHSPTNDLVAVAVVALLGLPFRKAGAEKGSGPNGT